MRSINIQITFEITRLLLDMTFDIISPCTWFCHVGLLLVTPSLEKTCSHFLFCLFVCGLVSYNVPINVNFDTISNCHGYRWNPFFWLVVMQAQLSWQLVRIHPRKWRMYTTSSECAVEVERHSRWPLVRCRGFGLHNSVDVTSAHA